MYIYLFGKMEVDETEKEAQEAREKARERAPTTEQVLSWKQL